MAFYIFYIGQGKKTYLIQKYFEVFAMKHIPLHTQKKKILFLCTLPFLSLLLFYFFTYHNNTDTKKFNKLTNTLFENEMRSNTLGMHYTLAYPENYGISEYDAVLPTYAGTANDCSILNYRNALQNIKKEKLTPKDRYTYTLLERFLTLASDRQNYCYFEDPLSPSSGMQTQLPILLSEYTFRSKRDVEDYLSLLDQTDTYFASLIAFEKEKIANGYPPARTSLSKVRTQCNTIMSKSALDSHTHFLQTTFSERLAQLSKRILLSKEQALEYVAQNDRLLKTVVLPAYEMLSDELLLLEDSSYEGLPKGLCSFPEGKAYYELLLQTATDSDLSIPKLKDMLLQNIAEESSAIQQLLKNNPSLPSALSQKEYENLSVSTPDRIIEDLKKRMEKDFPVFPKVDDSVCHISVKKVCKDMEKYCAPAFYLTSPADDTDTNVIYINPMSTTTNLELYTTLAHEGFPGHLYQNVYCNRKFTLEEDNKCRLLLWYGGYQEGWALYVEFLSFDYASKIMIENQKEFASTAITLEKHSRSLSLALYTLLDIMIHYENAGFYQVEQYLASFGISDTDAVESIYTYIAENPCNYAKYYVGYLEILALKKQAAKLWDHQFSELAFHTFFLENGPCDFPTLKKCLENYKPTSCQS